MSEEKVGCRTPAEGRDGVTNIPKWKFDLLRVHIVALVEDAGDDGLPFKGLSDRVAERLTADEKAKLGSVGWHVTCVKLELEVRGEIARRAGSGPQIIVAG